MWESSGLRSSDYSGQFSDEESALSGTASHELKVDILSICCYSDIPGYVK
jgi:hypothetical protein